MMRHVTQPRTVVGDRRPPSRGDRQRALIIDGVAELLADVPIANLSVSRVAEHVGVTRPAFYFYFESKYAVVAAALEEVWAEIDAATADLASYDFAEPPAQFSDRIITAVIEVWLRHYPVLRACLQARESDEQLSDLWGRFIGNLSAKLSAFIDMLNTDGRARPAIADTAALTQALLGMTIWALHEQHVGAQPASSERVMAAVRAVWLASAWGVTSD